MSHHHRLSLMTPSSSSLTTVDVARSQAFQNNFKFDNITVPPSAAPSRSHHPSLAPLPKIPSTTPSKKASSHFGFFVLSTFIVVVLFVLWRLWVRYQRSAEQRRQDFRAAQADRVLGDMQMVPNEDLDNELL